jgi:two-component system, NarL family, nitrate/nitrite sensor histidine kinase NarX
MRKLLSHKSFSTGIIQFLVFILSSAFLYLAWSLSKAPEFASSRFLLWMVAFLFAGVLAWQTGQQFTLRRKQEELQRNFGTIQDDFPEVKRRLDGVLRLNHSLLNAQDEKGLMDTALEVIANMAGASAVTFVPMDEWGQPLAPYTYGDMPESMLRAWANHLVAPAVRERCRVCSVKHALPDSDCPMLEGQFSRAVSIICLPLRRNERMLGMLNLHLPAEKSISPDLLVFLEGLLQEIALAIQTVRLRNQELNTLRQLQMVRTSKAELSVLLDSLLEGLQQVIDADFVIIHINAVEPWQNGVEVQKGTLPWADATIHQALMDQAIDSGQIERLSTADAQQHGAALAAPLQVSQGQIVGALLVANREAGFSAREEAILSNLAEQAALTVENERMFLLLEYNAVIQERVRLAREIHDGLAQTLAFLKMKTSQMQNYLTQGDTSRLDQVLQQHYQVLTDAYLDTRQAIDNLRQSTQHGLIHWLEQSASDFETASGLNIERNFKPPEREISPEVQAQLIRIVQEALSNVRKHARAQRAWISLHQWDGDLILEIGDDGQGFSPEDLSELTRYGLRGMRERAEFIGADFQITSQLRQGTLVRLRLPLYEETVL